MYKLAFSSFISKYSCLARLSPLASLCLLSLVSSHFPSSLLLFLLSGCLLSSQFCFLLPSCCLLLLPFLSCSCSSSSSLPLSSLWVVVAPYKSVDVNHDVPALCSIGYTHKATKSLSINTWMWYTSAHSLGLDTLNLSVLFLHVFVGGLSPFSCYILL